MTQRTAAVSSDVGAPFELISEKPPPITSATKARMPQTSEPLRALLQKKRDCDRSGFEPLEAVSFRAVMSCPPRLRRPRRSRSAPAWPCNASAIEPDGGHGCPCQWSRKADGRCSARSDVEEASNRDGRADGPDRHPHNDNDSVGEQDLGPRHV